MTKVALIEFGNSHDEVLFPQYQFLAAHPDFEPYLFVSEALKNRLSNYPKERLNFIPKEARSRDLKVLRRNLKSLGIRTIVFNTASGKKVRNFIWSSLSEAFEYYGVLHHLSKLKGSTTQRLISLKLKRYFLLSEYLAKAAREAKPRLKFHSFYASFLPAVATSDERTKGKDKIWIVIPGQVEYKRRDYGSLLDSLEGQASSKLRFILLGKSKHAHGDGRDLEKQIADRGLSALFKLWDEYVPSQEFNHYLRQADYVLPLIHGQHASAKLYQQQISGAWNMAAAKKIPLLLEEGAPGTEDFGDGAIFYGPKQLAELWPLLPQAKQDFYQDPKWSFEVQMKGYCDFLVH